MIDNRFLVTREIFKSRVYLVKDTYKKGKKAKKVLKIFAKGSRKHHDFEKEVEVNYRLSEHPQIMKIKEGALAIPSMSPVIIEGQQCTSYSYLVLPFCKRGTLLSLMEKLVRQKQSSSIGVVKYLVRQVIQAVAQMHLGEGYAHLDLKPENIIIKDDLQVALIDFAHANKIGMPLLHMFGTENYWPPEMPECRKNKAKLQQQQEKIDIFSLGIILFMITYQMRPFKAAQESDQLYQHFFQGDYQGYIMKHPATRTELQSQKLDWGFIQIIWNCLQPDPSQRPNIQQIMSHQYMQSTSATLTEEERAELDYWTLS